MSKFVQDDNKTNIIYLTKAQQAVYNFGSRNTTVEAGRATGKTSGMLSPYVLNCTRTMPGSMNLFLGCSIKQLFYKTVPSLIAAIEEITGLREGIHFVRGRPPQKLGFEKPLVRPKIWENCLCFWNGAIWMMTSTQIKAAANGMNVCAIANDECRFQKERVIKGEILPALRGLITDHPGFDEEKNPFFRSTMFTSDAPLTRSQGWMRKRKDEQTEEINRKIAALIREANETMQHFGIDITHSPKFQREINSLRCKSYIYFSFSSFENYELLGEEYFRSMKRSLTDTMFDISIRNIDTEHFADGYYSCFDVNVHLYENDDESQIHQACLKYNKKSSVTIFNAGCSHRIENETIDLKDMLRDNDCSLDVDLIPTEPLRIALDYNTKLSCIVTGQTPSKFNSQILRVLSSFAYIKSDRVEGLIKRWHKYYKPHQAFCKDVIYYYNATAKQGASYASEYYDETRFCNIVKKALKKYGWNVIEVPMGAPMSHSKKYEIINSCFAETMKPIVRINHTNNEFLAASIENAKILPGFKKNKSKEKYRTTVGANDSDVERELATRTDLSDAFDDLLIGVRCFGSGYSSGVGMPLC